MRLRISRKRSRKLPSISFRFEFFEQHHARLLREHGESSHRRASCDIKASLKNPPDLAAVARLSKIRDNSLMHTTCRSHRLNGGHANTVRDRKRPIEILLTSNIQMVLQLEVIEVDDEASDSDTEGVEQDSDDNGQNLQERLTRGRSWFQAALSLLNRRWGRCQTSSNLRTVMHNS